MPTGPVPFFVLRHHHISPSHRIHADLAQGRARSRVRQRRIASRRAAPWTVVDRVPRSQHPGERVFSWSPPFGRIDETQEMLDCAISHSVIAQSS